MQRAGAFLRNQALRLQQAERRVDNGSKVLPKYSDSNKTRARIFPRWILWKRFSVVRQGELKMMASKIFITIIQIFS